MTSLATLIYAPRSIALFSTGIFTGLGLTMNFVAVPSIKASKDPLPVFAKTYNNASKIAILSIIVGTVSNALCYHKTQDKRFLYSTILTFFSMPFTLLVIKPVNDQLFALQRHGDGYDRQQVYALVSKWNKLQMARTIAGLAAFMINILYQ